MKSSLIHYALCAAIALPLSNANAAFILTLDDLATAGIDVIVSDGAAIGTSTSVGATNNLDINTVLGAITFNGAVGNFTVNVTTGISEPTALPGTLDLNSINVSGNAGTLRIGLTDTDYAGTPIAYRASYGGTTNGSVDLDFLFDVNNAEFGGTSIHDPASVAPPAFSDSIIAAVNPTAPYSLSIFSDITHSAASQISSFDAELAPIPIPAAVWLFASGLVGLVGVARRRQS